MLDGIPFPTKAFSKYLESLDNYANDTEARAAGLVTNDHYFFSIETDSGIYNILKRVSPLL
jgi:hypothetical protein